MKEKKQQKLPKREAEASKNAVIKGKCIFIDEKHTWWSVKIKDGTDDIQFEVIKKYPTHRFNEEYIEEYNKHAPCIISFDGSGVISRIPMKRLK